MRRYLLLLLQCASVLGQGPKLGLGLLRGAALPSSSEETDPTESPQELLQEGPTFQSSLSSPYDSLWKGQACEGQVLELPCERDMVMTITATSWGVHEGFHCDGMDNNVTSECGRVGVAAISDMCDGQSFCSVNVTAEELGDPCPGVTKTLQLEYTCTMKTYTAYQCEDTETTLQCPEKQVIKVYDGFYGRLTDDFCNPLNDTSLSSTCAGTDDIGAKIGAVCDGKAQCAFMPLNEYLGDSCPGTYKYMGVNYVCGECSNYHGNETECEEWAAEGECEANPDWMASHCRKTCWQCTEPQADSCPDDDDLCPVWASWGECVQNPEYMTQYCRKSCHTCPDFIATEEQAYFATVCETDFAYANCGNRLGLYLRVDSVFFGRQGNETCPHESVLSLSCSLENESEALEKARRTCNGRESCMLGADVEQWGDPCPGNYKYFTVDHHCQRCENTDEDSVCEERKSQGLCETDADNMLDSCFKTCTQCNIDGCRNEHPDNIECDMWAINGQCEINPAWMQRNCRLSCRGCDGDAGPEGEDQKPCINHYPNCGDWAAIGECENNLDWMAENCRPACSQCLPISSCSDLYTDCHGWAEGGECEANSDWMSRFCQKSCQQCPGREQTDVCINKDVDCGYWASIGECEGNNTEWMARNCRRACDQCTPKDTCSDSYSDCFYWETIGECDINNEWMTDNCRKSCAICESTDEDNEQDSCIDKHQNCQKWIGIGECTNNPIWMDVHCRKSCGKCTDGGDDGNSNGDNGNSNGDNGNSNGDNGNSNGDDGNSNGDDGNINGDNGNINGDNEVTTTPVPSTSTTETTTTDATTTSTAAPTTSTAAPTTSTAAPTTTTTTTTSPTTSTSTTSSTTSSTAPSVQSSTTLGDMSSGAARCIDNDNQCPYRAYLGECTTNPTEMNTLCPKACQQCFAVPRPGCQNALLDDDQCSAWASEGDCLSNPTFMGVTCRRACGHCEGTDCFNCPCRGKVCDVGQVCRTMFGSFYRCTCHQDLVDMCDQECAAKNKIRLSSTRCTECKCS